MISILYFMQKMLSIYDSLGTKGKEIINYIFVGGLTTVVSIASYNLLRLFIDKYEICTFLSWIFAVLFAYFANRHYVFKSRDKNILKEFISFVSSRIFSLFAELATMYILVDLVKIDDRISKIIVQVIVMILNYFFSKMFVFRDRNYVK